MAEWDGLGGRDGAWTLANSCAPGGGCSHGKYIVIVCFISVHSFKLAVGLLLSRSHITLTGVLTSLLALEVFEPPEGDTGNLSKVGRPSGNSM